jgi:hypothetical protein
MALVAGDVTRVMKRRAPRRSDNPVGLHL